MATLILYGTTAILVGLSFYKNRTKTRKAMKKAWKSFMKVLPAMIGLITMIGIVLAVFDEELISRLIGSSSGMRGVIISAVIGSITLIPGFIAFPTAALLLENGAGYMQIGAFISTLMMVGIVTIPVEVQYFGKKVTVLRNLLSFGFSFLIAYIIGLAVSI